MSFKTYALAFCLLLLPSVAFAGGFCCQMPTGVQEALYGSSAPGAGKFQLRLDYSYSHMEKFIDGSSEKSLSEVSDDPRFMQKGGVVPESMDMNRITLSGSYAPTEKLRVLLSVPWVINDMTMRSNNGMMWMSMKMDEVSDLGDVTLIGLYRFYQDEETAPSMVFSAGAGLKFPTGSHTVRENGNLVHAHMQPGTGSWDPLLTLNFADMLSSAFLLSADATYQIATRNSLEYSYGDTFALNTYLKYNLADFLNLSLGLNYFHSEPADDPDNSYRGQDSRRLTDFVGYTGEDSIWVSPGIQVLPFKNASVDFKFQYPVFYSVNGVQQVTDYRLLAGMSYSF